MKVAVQLYGHLRTFRECAPALKQYVLDRYDCDVFIHTWDRTEHGDKTWYDKGVKCKPELVDNFIVSQLRALYSPIIIKIDKQNLFSESGHYGTDPETRISLQGMKYMVYGQYTVNRLRNEYQSISGVDYDYVIVVRPDVMPFVPLDLSLYQHEFEYYDNCSIHLIHDAVVKVKDSKVFHYPLIADCFYLARPCTVDKITSVFEKFDYFYKEIARIFPAKVENPEISFVENMLQNGVLPRQYIFFYAIKRHNSENDIRLLPEGQLDEGSRELRSIRLAKYILNLLSKYAPAFVTQVVIQICKKIALSGQYLEKITSSE